MAVLIRETCSQYNKPFNGKYTIVFANWNDQSQDSISKYGWMVYYFKLRNNETLQYIDIPMVIQNLLKSLYFNLPPNFISWKQTFITADEDVRTKLGINLLKTMISVIENNLMNMIDANVLPLSPESRYKFWTKHGPPRSI